MRYRRSKKKFFVLKDGRRKEEYAAELAPRHLHLQKRKEKAVSADRVDVGAIMGYMALFLALFSIMFYPIAFGSLSVILGLLAASYGARTLGYTAIGFGGFSVLFSLLYPLFFA
ncbi:hypothetical protein ACFDTO_37015 [Microbacteriaceae bacterium 4G12]